VTFLCGSQRLGPSRDGMDCPAWPPLNWLMSGCHGDELTPTSKLKRRVIAAKYADVIKGLYRSA